MLGKEIDGRELCLSFLIGETIVRNGWFLQAIVLFYLIFYFSFRYLKRYKIEAVVAACVVYCVVCKLAGLSSTWYECSLCFPMGMYVAKYKERLDAVVDRRYWMILACACVGFGLTFLLVGMTPVCPIVFKMMSSLLFAAVAVLLIQKIPVQGKVTEWLGGLYMEIYVLQGLVLNVLKEYGSELSPFAHFALVIAITLPLAAVMKRPFALLMNAVKKK